LQMTKGYGFALFLLLIIFVSGCNWHSKDFLSSEERIWINEHYNSIVVAPDPRWKPNEAVGQQQIYQGLTSDYMELVEQKLGVRFLRLYTQSWKQVLEAEKRGEIDIHPVLVKSSERSKEWLFTDPYLRIPMIVVIRASLKEEFSPSKMSELKMGVGSGYGIDDFVAEHCSHYNIVPVESDRFGLIKASMGEIDLMITDLASASYYIEREGLTNLRLAATMGSLYEFSFASRRDNPMLHRILNKALNQISRDEMSQIYDHWIVFDTQPFYKIRSFWYSAGFALLTVMAVIIVIVFLNITLKNEVKSKTQELRKANEMLEERVEERTEQLSEINRLLQHKIEERAEMAREILNISGSERARIGRELHDSIGQEMVGITFLCRAVEDNLRENFSEDADQVERITEHVENAIAGMKRIVRGLLPVDIMDKGLVVALSKLVRESEKMYGIKCSFNCGDENHSKVSNITLATNLYRIAQEAVSNAAKHASAKTIIVSFGIKNKQGVLSIRDDGYGVDKKDAHAGMGLNIMRYRAELARGNLTIKSDPKRGTEVICMFDQSSGLDECNFAETLRRR